MQAQPETNMPPLVRGIISNALPSNFATKFSLLIILDILSRRSKDLNSCNKKIQDKFDTDVMGE